MVRYGTMWDAPTAPKTAVSSSKSARVLALFALAAVMLAGAALVTQQNLGSMTSTMKGGHATPAGDTTATATTPAATPAGDGTQFAAAGTAGTGNAVDGTIADDGSATSGGGARAGGA